MTNPAVNQAWLTSHGRLSWQAARDLLGDSACIWMDLDGVHLEQAPAEAPLASHLWAWNDNALFRLRVDGAEAIAARLDLRKPDNVDGCEEVQTSESVTESWPPKEFRVSVADQWRGLPVRITTVHGITPLSFARLDKTTTGGRMQPAQGAQGAQRPQSERDQI